MSESPKPEFVKVVPDDWIKFFTRLHVLLKSVFESVRKSRESKESHLQKCKEIDFLFKNGLAKIRISSSEQGRNYENISNDMIKVNSDSERGLTK